MSQIQPTIGKHTTILRRSFVALIGLAPLLINADASALPKLGGARPSIKLIDGWDRSLDLSKLERPLLLIYEDKDSSAENQALKDELVRLEQSQHYRKYVAHVVVADVSAYDYWPAKGIAKGELQKWSERLKLVVYGDFSGQAKKSLAIDSGHSNVLLYSKEGKVLFAHSGPLTDPQRNVLIDRLRAEAQQTSPPVRF
jgi:hypothetical protein